jgi:hypothetical protein
MTEGSRAEERGLFTRGELGGRNKAWGFLVVSLPDAKPA